MESNQPKDLASLNLKCEGFWYSKYEPHLPVPVANVESWPQREVFLMKLLWVETFAQKLRYMGSSNCRICGQGNRSETCIAEGWAWPSGFKHYVSEHNLRPSDDFIAFIKSFQIEKPDLILDLEKLFTKRYEMTPKIMGLFLDKINQLIVEDKLEDLNVCLRTAEPAKLSYQAMLILLRPTQPFQEFLPDWSILRDRCEADVYRRGDNPHELLRGLWKKPNE